MPSWPLLPMRNRRVARMRGLAPAIVATCLGVSASWQPLTAADLTTAIRGHLEANRLREAQVLAVHLDVNAWGHERLLAADIALRTGAYVEAARLIGFDRAAGRLHDWSPGWRAWALGLAGSLARIDQQPTAVALLTTAVADETDPQRRGEWLWQLALALEADQRHELQQSALQRLWTGYPGHPRRAEAGVLLAVSVADQRRADRLLEAVLADHAQPARVQIAAALAWCAERDRGDADAARVATRLVAQFGDAAAMLRPWLVADGAAAAAERSATGPVAAAETEVEPRDLLALARLLEREPAAVLDATVVAAWHELLHQPAGALLAARAAVRAGHNDHVERWLVAVPARLEQPAGLPESVWETTLTTVWLLDADAAWWPAVDAALRRCPGVGGGMAWARAASAEPDRVAWWQLAAERLPVDHAWAPQAWGELARAALGGQTAVADLALLAERIGAVAWQGEARDYQRLRLLQAQVLAELGRLDEALSCLATISVAPGSKGAAAVARLEERLTQAASTGVRP